VKITIARVIDQLAYRSKALTAAASALIITAAVVADKQVTGEELIALISAWAAVFGVHQVENAPKP
jgi:hypothetical protein